MTNNSVGRREPIRASLAATIVALCSQGRADPAPAIHCAPAENLEHVDVAFRLAGRSTFYSSCQDGTFSAEMRSLTLTGGCPAGPIGGGAWSATHEGAPAIQTLA